MYENSGNRENAVQNPATGILYKVRGFFIIRKRQGSSPENKKELCPEMEKMMRYIDMHCDTLGSALAQKTETFLELDHTMVDGLRLQQAEAGAQFFAMFLPQRNDPDWFGLEEMPPVEALMRKMYDIFCHTMEQYGDRFAAAHNAEELKQNQNAEKISAFLTIENGALIDGKMDKIREIYDLGVRLVTLTWNDDNCLGHCHSKKSEEMSRGLTGFGKEAVRYMQELGILVDVSHLSDGGFWDVAEASRRSGVPFVASHSNCRALAPATRNLTDEMIRELAECGGVAGLNLEPTFLNEDETDKVSRIERICDHAMHLIDRGGIECVGLGTDFDGISGEFEISDCTKLPLLFDALRKRGLSEDAVEQIAYQNTARVIRDGMR